MTGSLFELGPLGTNMYQSIITILIRISMEQNPMVKQMLSDMFRNVFVRKIAETLQSDDLLTMPNEIAAFTAWANPERKALLVSGAPLVNTYEPDERKKFFGRLFDKIKNTVASLGINALLPFKGGMKKYLTIKGITPKSNFKALVEQFYAQIKGGNFEGVDPISISIIIQAILSFFKQMQDKQEKTQEEEEILDTIQNNNEGPDGEVTPVGVLSDSGNILKWLFFIVVAFGVAKYMKWI